MLRLLFCRLLPLLVVLLAVLVGYIAQSPSPVGTVFWLAAQPMLLSFTATPPVPADMRPLPRPEGEVFRPLLGSGDEMPAAGLGMCCRATAYHEKSVYNTVLWYLLRGGRHIDTAQLYYNHRPIGRAIKEAMQRGVSRDEIFVTTKIEAGYFGTKNTAAWVPQMLEELQLDYVDLVLLHFPRKWLGLFGGVDEFQSCCGCASPRECREQTWHVLSGARENGLIKNVGVSNHLIYQIDELRALDKAPVAVNQLQYHPWVPQWQEDIAQHCRENGIQLMAYSPLGGAMNAGSVGVTETIVGIGKKHGASSHQVMLRWAVQSGMTVIPGTGNPAHIRQNINAYSFTLDGEDMAAISRLGEDKEFAKKFMFFGGPESQTL